MSKPRTNNPIPIAMLCVSIWPVLLLRFLSQSLELDLRHYETERWPATRFYRALKPRFCSRHVALQEKPVPDTIAERCNLNVSCVGWSKHLIWSNLSPIK